MPIVKKRQIENLEQMSGEELRTFLDSLPAGQQTISSMLDFIEDELYDAECDHHLRHAMKFMMDNRLDFPRLTSWLNENGGYCDCKVMEQISARVACKIWRRLRKPDMKTVFFVLALLTFPTVLQAQTGTTPIKLYFHNEKMNPNAQDCNKVFPVTRRIPKTKAIARAALDELLKGPTKEEAAKEYWGFGPPDTDGILKSIRIKNGAAYVNFTARTLEQMGNATTSCGSAFFTMVEKTLTQFPSIRKVYYAIEGDTNEFYEWVQVGECPHGRHCAKKNFQ